MMKSIDHFTHLFIAFQLGALVAGAFACRIESKALKLM